MPGNVLRRLGGDDAPLLKNIDSRDAIFGKVHITSPRRKATAPEAESNRGRKTFAYILSDLKREF